jgi:hypothetical protein
MSERMSVFQGQFFLLKLMKKLCIKENYGVYFEIWADIRKLASPELNFK